MKLRITLGCFLLALACMARADAPAVDLEAQRQAYTAALEAARRGDEARYRALYKKLDGYVLRGYAQYEYLKDRLDRTPVPVVRQFLDENLHTPLPDMLRQKWLHVLADRAQWQTFLSEYADVPDDAELACLQIGRLLKAGERTNTVMARIEKLWLNGRRQPAACDAAFAAWKSAGHMTADKVWERIQLAMEAGNVSLAGELAANLPAKERVWVERWRLVYRDPLQGLTEMPETLETPVARMIVRHGIVRLAQRDPEEAMQQWQALKRRHAFFGEDEDYVLRHIALIAAQRHSPRALEWLSAVSVRADDAQLMQWRVYAALRAGDWDAVRRFIAALPEVEQATHRWRYWNARATEQKGNKREAKKIYVALAQERDYYGFLSADRLEASYSMQHVAVEAKPEEVAALAARPGMRAAKELYALGLIVDARRQWGWVMRDLNRRELEVAAVLAREWGWYDRAIQAAALSGQSNDLELRFPVLYRDVIEGRASEQGIDPGWVYGVVRQESAFVTDARSPAGALGLMQLMPGTGKQTLQRLKIRAPVKDALLNIEQNVRVGVGYLKEVLERYNGNQLLATAAYNAGPHRVRSWLPSEQLDADVWAETIPFNETRGYVKNVFAFAAVYDHRLGRKPTRLTTRMPLVSLVATDERS